MEWSKSKRQLSTMNHLILFIQKCMKSGSTIKRSRRVNYMGRLTYAWWNLSPSTCIVSQHQVSRGVAPRLGVRGAGEVDSTYGDFGEQIVEKLQSKKYQRFKNFMPLTTLLKQIGLIYNDRVRMMADNQRVRDVSCANFSYLFLSKLFGLKQIVD